MPRTEAELRDRVAEGGLIARGNGRSYGDSSLSLTNTVDMRRFNRMLAFDASTGQLTAEAGVMLADIIAAFLPRGFFPAVTPGTKFVTVGGMIAADVHGKNQHKDGTFGDFVDRIDLLTASGQTVRCSRDSESELFGWTIGGMGLTGVILRAAFRLRRVESAWVRQDLSVAPNLDAALSALDAANRATYSVAWMDGMARGAGLGRSLIITGEHAAPEDLPPKRQSRPLDLPRRPAFSVPVPAPSFVLNNLTVKAFNLAYYRARARQTGRSLVDLDGFFYPLDSVLGWNRLYGRRGFVQLQCVLPPESAQSSLRALLRETANALQQPFLAVLKQFGPQESRFSFPMAGNSLALDFPRGRDTLDLMRRLDRIVIDHGGRFYLAKDAWLSADALRKSDVRVEALRALRSRDSAAQAFSSAQSERLEL